MTRTTTLAVALVLALPEFAFAADGTVPVPGWLSVGAGAVGLLVAVLLMVDAVLLRRVSDGSMIAENIGYMMLAVICFAASMLARWVGILIDFREVTALIAFAADLLMTAGMALMAVYFYRVRTAMTRYLKGLQAYKASAEENEVSAGG